jgi:hypothetical protein
MAFLDFLFAGGQALSCAALAYGAYLAGARKLAEVDRDELMRRASGSRRFICGADAG